MSTSRVIRLSRGSTCGGGGQAACLVRRLEVAREELVQLDGRGRVRPAQLPRRQAREHEERELARHVEHRHPGRAVLRRPPTPYSDEGSYRIGK